MQFNGHFLAIIFTEASYVFEGENNTYQLDGVVRQLVAQHCFGERDSEAWERRRVCLRVGTGGGKA